MEIDPVIDTIMNIEVFIFIGLMVWLYLREGTADSGGGANEG